MSLKTFHIVFISLSALVSFGFGSWCFQYHMAYQEMVYLVGGVLSFLAGGGLIIYGVRFLKKFKDLPFM